MSFYEEMQSLASDVLSEFKQGSIKLIQLITPENSTADEPLEAIETIHELDATSTGNIFQYLKEGYAVAGDMLVIASVIEGVTPSINDFIEIDGVTHKLIKDMSVPSAGIKVVWKFIVRRGG